MFRLVIADDEELTRRGLSEFTDWQSMGFEVAAAFEDGRETIEFLSSNHVDVVLTDIKMAEVSGTEVARYVHEKRPEVRVVFLSAYREFEDAKAAIEYGVEHYLLKPVRAGELARVFREVRDSLDRERAAAARASDEKRQHDRLIRLFQEHYFRDFITGTWVDRAEAFSLLRDMGLGVDPATAPCHLLRVRLALPSHTPPDGSPSWKDRLRTYVHEQFTTYDGPIVPFPVTEDERNLVVVCFLPRGTKDAYAALTTLASQLRIGIRRELGVRCTVGAPERLDIFLAASRDLDPKPAGLGAAEPGGPAGADARALRRYHEPLLAAICAGDVAATSARVDHLFEAVRELPTDTVRNLMVRIFATLSYRMESFGIEPDRLSPGWQDYTSFLRLGSTAEIRQRCTQTIIDCAQEIGERKRSIKGLIVERAKEYIRENCQKDITLHDVSSHVYLSPIYFSHVFRKEAGVTFMDFLTAARMERAGELLRGGLHKVSEVGEAVGYQSTKYFSRLFRKHHGVGPREYRRNLPVSGAQR